MTQLVCDTIPAARLADQKMMFEPVPEFHHATTFDNADTTMPEHHQRTVAPPQSQPRKLCARHQRMADEGTNIKLQQSLETLPLEEREAINTIWSNFSSSSQSRRALILQGLLTMCCFSQLSLISEQLTRLIRIDPFLVLPREICLKILGYLDGTSLCRAAQVSKRWKALGDDNVLWKGICEQHIGQRCHNCGVHLPVLKNAHRFRSTSPPIPVQPQPLSTIPSSRQQASSSSTPTPSPASLKRDADPCSGAFSPPLKRRRSDSSSSSSSVRPTSPTTSVSARSDDTTISSSSVLPSDSTLTQIPSTRPWKDVFGERMAVEHNWRRGRCKTRTLTGHTDGVMCLQFHEALSCPPFPVLISGSYDRTVRVWNMETGEQLHCLRGHSHPVRALQFDEMTLITGSMDCTLKVWNWRQGTCIRTLRGHMEGVVCLNYDSNVLASGSVDSTIIVWNLRAGGSFVLRGHSDWVNSVQLWDSNRNSSRTPEDTSFFSRADPMPPFGSTNCSYQIDPGKMLFSASDDGTIKLWDLNTRTCVRQFLGHMGQVQSMVLLYNEELETEESEELPASLMTSNSIPRLETVLKYKKPALVSGSLDNTVKIWDIETGKATTTYFGHIEGVWAVASDKMRLVSGSHDRTIKVWSRDSQKCLATLIEHQAAVSCLSLGEDKIVSGSDDKTIKIWSFSE